MEKFYEGLNIFEKVAASLAGITQRWGAEQEDEEYLVVGAYFAEVSTHAAEIRGLLEAKIHGTR